MRHGIADRVSGSSELELTEEGKRIVRQTLEVARAFALAKPERIYCSPLKRAQQTAAIAHEVLDVTNEIKVSDALRSETEPLAALGFIASIASASPTMLVGHDPLFSIIASMLVAGTDMPLLGMQKSAICAIELTRFEVPRMRGVLRLFLPPVII